MYCAVFANYSKEIGKKNAILKYTMDTGDYPPLDKGPIELIEFIACF